MRRIFKVTNLYEYIGSSTWYQTEEDTIHYAESIPYHGDDYYYFIEERDGKYLAVFYTFNYKKAYLQLK